MTIGLLDSPSSTVLPFPKPLLRPLPPPTDRSSPGSLARLLTQALDALDEAIIVTDRRAVVLHANAAARAALASGAFLLRGEVLHAPTYGATRALQAAVAECAQKRAPHAVDLTAETSGLTVTVMSANGPDLGSTHPDAAPAAMVVLRRTDASSIPSQTALQATYELTPAEAKLAREVARGDGLQACAKRLHITTNTARTHLKRIFDKTGAKRQAQLVRLLLGGCPNATDGP